MVPSCSPRYRRPYRRYHPRYPRPGSSRPLDCGGHLQEDPFYFADQVSANVSGFCIDPAAHAHEQSDQRPPSSEAQEGFWSGPTEDDEDDRPSK